MTGDKGNMKPTQKDKKPTKENNSVFSGMTKWHCFVLIGMSSGTIIEGLIPHSFGTFIANFRTEINSTLPVKQSDLTFSKVTQFQLGWLPAISSALPCLLLPLFSILVKRLKRLYQILSIISFLFVASSCILSSLVMHWELMIFTYSCIYSIGTSMFLAVLVSLLAEYFPVEHRCHVFATSLYQIGYPTSSLIGNPSIAKLIVKYGWRNALRYVGYAQLSAGIFIAFLMKPRNHDIFCTTYSSKCKLLKMEEEDTSYVFGFTKSTTSQIIKTPQLWPWLLGKYINYLCWYGLRTNIITYIVKSTNFGLERSATLISVYAGTEIVFGLTVSMIGEKLRGRLVLMHLLAAMSMTILIGILLKMLTTYLSAVFIMMAIGAAVQCSLCFGYPASVEVLNSEFDMKTGWIITNVAAGLGILSSPIISGLVMDKFSLVALLYSQCMGWLLQVICFALTLLIMCINRRRHEDDYIEMELDP